MHKNGWVIAALVALMMIVLVAAAVWPKDKLPEADAPSLTADAATDTAEAGTNTPDASSAPTDTPSLTDEDSPVTVTPPEGEPEATDAPAKAYLLVTVGNVVYQPVALTKEGTYTVTQQATGAVNVIHVTEDSVNMASSTCENQDCVEQGVVTLENKSERILGNMIICLPNQVTLELYTPEEMRNLLMSIQGGQEE